MYNRTRSQLTETDCMFIAHTLGETSSERDVILQQTEDPTSMTSLLHEKKLFERSLTTPPMFLTISPQLFFYVFIYQALDFKHLADDDLADYVAGVCVEFRSSEAMWKLAAVDGGKTVYFIDLLNILPDLDKPQQYFLRRYIGDISLFLTGFFPDFIFQRNQNIGAPPMNYYERIGQAQFETAAEHSERYDASATPVLSMLGERFVDVRSAINIFTDNYLQLHNDKYSLQRIQRQAATLDEESFGQSLMV